jgi:hypothetical protein
MWATRPWPSWNGTEHLPVLVMLQDERELPHRPANLLCTRLRSLLAVACEEEAMPGQLPVSPPSDGMPWGLISGV